jgi:hypothetical protein
MNAPACKARETPVDKFIRQRNVDRYLQMLKIETNETMRARVLSLLAEEQQKQKDAGDPSHF